MRRSALLLPLLLCFFAHNVFAQTGQVGGLVHDASQAVVPGVTITSTNTDTGIISTQITNGSGGYKFPSVPAGTYSVIAPQAGFKTSVTSGVQVSLAPVRVNIALDAGQLESRVEVVSPLDNLLNETSASVGVALTQQQVTDLPLVGQNVLDLLSVLPGFRESSLVGTDLPDRLSTVSGLNLDHVNTTINGLSTVSPRDAPSVWGRQVMTSNVINPDLVGGVRLILSPVDVELGRGNAQVQIQTRSGTNRYTGSVVWDIQNSALNANTWSNKRTAKRTEPDWYNLNQITASYSGPIIRNKTCFFVLYDTQMVNRRSLVTTQVLTDTARQGIWRYWEGWNPGPASASTSFTPAGLQPSGTAPSVDFDGNPIAPLFNPTGGPYTLGGLRCFSLFGNVKVDGSSFTQADCPGGTAVIRATPWDW